MNHGFGVLSNTANTEAGLSEQEAIARLKQDGYNEIPSARSRNLFAIAWDIAQDPIFLLLVGGGIIYWILGDLQEGLILLGFVFFIMGISLYQEGKTEHAMEALRNLSSPRALVIRDVKAFQSALPKQIISGRKLMQVNAYAAQSAKTPLTPFDIQRRDLGKRDVQIDILYCGVCHSDLHTVRSEWGGTTYPCVPGHEIVGRVAKVGTRVSKFEEGDIVGVGCMVDACLTCANCEKDLEQFCEKGTVWTYNAPDKHIGGMTFGGYSESIVVDKAFVLKIPEHLDLAAAAPLLCAGITTYSPLRHNNVRKGQKVGIVGLGGLGHMGVKLAKAFGAHVVVFTTSPSKVEDALRLGADEVVISKNADEMKPHLNSFDFILDTVSAQHDINVYLLLLGRDGNLTQVDVPPKPLSLDVGSLIFGRRSLSGSLIGGIKETQEMLDFCGKHNITADIELIPIQNINEAYDRLMKSDVKYRFVIDMASLHRTLSATD